MKHRCLTLLMIIVFISIILFLCLNFSVKVNVNVVLKYLWLKERDQHKKKKNTCTRASTNNKSLIKNINSLNRFKITHTHTDTLLSGHPKRMRRMYVTLCVLA